METNIHRPLHFILSNLFLQAIIAIIIFIIQNLNLTIVEHSDVPLKALRFAFMSQATKISITLIN